MAGVLFRVDAGPGVGLGHLQRSLSLASALRERGADCLFLTNEAVLSAERIDAFGFPYEVARGGTSWGPEDVERTRAAASKREWTTVVVDSLRKKPDYLPALKGAGLSVCTIEDLAPWPFPSELVVNGDAHASQLQYQSSSGDSRFLLGPQYSILRQELWEFPARRVRSRPAKVLLTLGGADDHNLMPSLLRVIGRLSVPLEVTALIGPYFKHPSEVREAAHSLSLPVRLAEAPTSVRSFLEETDLAVSAAGQTLYELARVGCPTVSFSFPTGPDQEMQLEAIAQAGCALSVGYALKGDLSARVGESLEKLLREESLRSAMAAAGQRLVDGQGAHRVAEAVLALAQGRRTKAEASHGAR